MCLPLVLCFFYYIFQSKIGRNVSGAPQVFDEMRQRDVGALERNVNATARVLKGNQLIWYLSNFKNLLDTKLRSFVEV
ncbi:hypothetical protein SDJN02_18483 [Cucurbita argyrosperma subsp. argyrosperma]|nr:hypothetical protein SDJN02_18483 [Cucurbita argyrosperma subsp. argyrosperma]